MRLWVDFDVDPSGNTCYVENLGHVVMLTLEEYRKELAEKKKKVLQIKFLALNLYIILLFLHYFEIRFTA